MDIEKAGYTSWMNVIECILETMIEGSNWTRAIHQCNLTKDQFQVYQNFLLTEGFINEAEQDVEITKKGREFLRDYRKLKTDLL